jgi:hypothetical protein
MSSDEDEPEFVSKTYYAAPTTRTLYRITPTAVGDLSRSSRQIAIVAAISESDARTMAAKADPFRQDWLDEKRFACDARETDEDHVVGDVTFVSAPVTLSPQVKRKNRHG